MTNDEERKTWNIKDEGASLPAGTRRTQANAIEARDHKSELVIHDRHNRLRDEDSFGDDSNQPKDRKH